SQLRQHELDHALNVSLRLMLGEIRGAHPAAAEQHAHDVTTKTAADVGIDRRDVPEGKLLCHRLPSRAPCDRRPARLSSQKVRACARASAKRPTKSKTATCICL